MLKVIPVLPLASQDFGAMGVQRSARDLSNLSTSRFPTMQPEVWDLKLLFVLVNSFKCLKKIYQFFYLEVLLKEGIKDALPL